MILLADADRDAANQSLLIWGGILVATLLVGAAILAWLDRWRKRQLDPQADAVDNLTAFRLSYERGELTEEEYRRIRTRLAAGEKPTSPAKSDETLKKPTP